MSANKQLEHLKVLCKEALETKRDQLSVVPRKIQEQLNNLAKVEQLPLEELKELFEKHQKDFLEGDRTWLLETELILAGIDISYCFKLAENQGDDLASELLYRVYRILELSEILEGEHLQTIQKRANTIKSLLEGDASIGPSGIEQNFLTNNIGGIIQSIVPMFTSLSQSPEFKKVIEKAVPKESFDGNNQPDISAIIKNTLGVFESEEGKNLFGKIAGSLQPLKK
jgi:hypothetical protein